MIISRTSGYSILIFLSLFLAGCGSTTQIIHQPDSPPAIERVPAGKFDTGRMWTFDFPPIGYFSETYGFYPDDQWFRHARLAALRLPNCTASFVSADGLVMTNHHCAVGALQLVTRENENLLDNGFYARTMEEERKVDGLYVDQLVYIEDVTGSVLAAFEEGTSDEAKIESRNRKMKEIQLRCSEERDLNCSVITFYNGGRYSLYGYKRYQDVRLVFTPESAVGFFGGDPDNFTYPRYNLDLAFLRVYNEDGTPHKPEYYYAWSSSGAWDGDPVFVIGNPGRTSRLLTIAQLEFMRDMSYPLRLRHTDGMVEILRSFLGEFPDKKLKYEPRVLSLENTQKAFRGMISTLHDPSLMGRKLDFEENFREAVQADPALRTEYAAVWGEIGELQKQKRAIFDEMNALTLRGLSRSAYFGLASDLVEYARQMQMPADERDANYRNETVDATKSGILSVEIDHALERRTLAYQLKHMESVFGETNTAFNELLGDSDPMNAASKLIDSSILRDVDGTKALLDGDPADVLQTADPFISFVAATSERQKELRSRYDALVARESAQIQLLGKALYEIYGTTIPPDATFSLRIADGFVRSYEYNGTVAPPVTTFYGMYDRYYSFSRRDPWTLPQAWVTPPGEFRLSTPFNFISTNDIIGGNSGSPVINTKLEIVGLAFDGNIESLSGDFIYSEEKNRAVSVHSDGILESLRYMYNARRIVRELESGSTR